MARNFQFVRGFLGKRRQQRSLSVNVRLLGAYHDGYIELRYPRVSRYALNVTDGERGHRDWRYMSFASLTEDTWSMKSSGRVSTPLAFGLSRHRILNSAGAKAVTKWAISSPGRELMQS